MVYIKSHMLQDPGQKQWSEKPGSDLPADPSESPGDAEATAARPGTQTLGQPFCGACCSWTLVLTSASVNPPSSLFSLDSALPTSLLVPVLGHHMPSNEQGQDTAPPIAGLLP